MPTAPVPRRTWLRLAAALLPGASALLTTGCAMPRPPRPAASPKDRNGPVAGDTPARGGSSAAAAPIRLTVDYPFTQARGLLDRFNATHPSVTAVAFSRPQPVYLAALAQGTVFSRAAPYLRALDGALRVLNFNPATLLPGGVEAFALSGRTLALPTTVRPWCVAWRTDAFQAAGLPDPDPQWTLDAFEAACAGLQHAAAAGRVKGLAAALSPAVGQYRITDTSHHSIQFLSGTLTEEGLWEGFALGFGGAVIDRGRFVLTDPGTVAGLGRLVSIGARYGLPPAKVPAQVAGLSQLLDLYALDLVPYGPDVTGLYDPRWRFARFPRLPVVPVVPTLFMGAGLITQPRTTAGAVAPYANAAAEFLVWSSGSEAQALLTGAGVAPVSADAATQQRFWSAAPAKSRAVGDWQHFVNYAEGWPAYPPTPIMADALTQAVQAPSTLGALLAGAEQKMNAAVATALNAAPASPPV